METIKNEIKDTRNSRLVFDARVARTLCKKGFVITDIKPNRENNDKSIFIYANTPEFQVAYEEICNEYKKKDELKKESIERPEMAD